MLWEIDRYYDGFQGLFIAKVELPNSEVQAKMPKVISDVLIRDVTNDKSYKNKELAKQKAFTF